MVDSIKYIRDIVMITYHSIRMNFHNYDKNTPILIYQMGKVGSTTILRSLERAKLPNHIYHVHYLSGEGFRKAEEHYKKLQMPLPRHVRLCAIMRKKFDKNKLTTEWKIITLVRDPIARFISDFFQNVWEYWPDLISDNGKLNKMAVLDFIKKILCDYDVETDFTSTWFDREMYPYFNVNVYSYPFDHHNGFTIISERNIKLLIIRMEDMDNNFERAISEFIGISKPIKMIKDNIGIRKDYSEDYKYILENLSLPRTVCSRIYSSKYAKHFYTQSMIRELIHKWSVG